MEVTPGEIEKTQKSRRAVLNVEFRRARKYTKTVYLFMKILNSTSSFHVISFEQRLNYFRTWTFGFTFFVSYFIPFLLRIKPT